MWQRTDQNRPGRGLRSAAIGSLTAVMVLASTPQSAVAQSGNEPLRWVGCGISRKAYVAALAQAFQRRTGIQVEIEGGGATRGIREVASLNADMGGTCRHRIPGVEAEQDAVLKPVAWDSLVVIVNPGNPVDDISFRQIQDLFLGKITDWSALGGPSQPIELFTREGKISGVGRGIRKLVFANFDQEFKSSRSFKDSGPLEQAVEQAPWSIAITGISSARKRNVKILTLDGKEPSYDNIRSGEYVLYRPLYLALNPAGKNRHLVDQFVQFAYSPEGMAVIRRSGVVPYNDALHLVMKQLEQEERAQSRGLYGLHTVVSFSQ